MYTQKCLPGKYISVRFPAQSLRKMIFPLSIEREPTTDDCKPQGTKNTLDPDPKENEPKLMGRDPLEGGH